jgi:hypothetical protein
MAVTAYQNPQVGVLHTLFAKYGGVILWLKYKGRFSRLHSLCLKLSHATCLQLELYCVNQAQSLPTLSSVSCVLDLHSATQVVSRLHATVLDKSCV